MIFTLALLVLLLILALMWGYFLGHKDGFNISNWGKGFDDGYKIGRQHGRIEEMVRMKDGDE